MINRGMATTYLRVTSDMYFKHVKVDVGDEMHIHFRQHSMRMQVKGVEPIFSKAYPSLEIGVSVETEIVGVID